VKIYPTPGNHDVRWNPRGKEGYTRGTGRPLYESWDHENVHFVTLDSTVLLEHWGHISRESLNWLAEDLKKVGPDRPS
jgi:3',5'-cyclic AMP phosphodiesterase CpdA